MIVLQSIASLKYMLAYGSFVLFAARVMQRYIYTIVWSRMQHDKKYNGQFHCVQNTAIYTPSKTLCNTNSKIIAQSQRVHCCCVKFPL